MPNHPIEDYFSEQPAGRCRSCGRVTYDAALIGTTDRMPQPGGDPCGGNVRAIGEGGEVKRLHLSREDLAAYNLIADDELWRATEATAKHNGESVAATVRRALAEYLIEKGWSEQ